MEETLLIHVLFIFSCVQTTSADLEMSPRYTTSFIGDSVTFRCEGLSVPKRSIYWIHIPVGATTDSYIFAGPSGILYDYKLEGRHDVTFDESARTSQLVIKNIKLEDGGTYAISTDSKEQSQADLVVIKSAPVCSSNISLSSILVDNDCSLEPDHIRLDCSVASHGNHPPVLEWRHSMNPDVIIPGDGATSIHSVHLRPEFRWNGTNFICSIKDLQPPMQRGACGTPNISVEYFFKSTKFDKLGKIANVSCLANTSEQCSYEWRATEVRTNNPVVIQHQTIQLNPNYFELFNDVRCFATCNIQGRVCTAQPMELILSMKETNSGDNNSLLVILLPVLLTFVVILATVMASILIRRWKRHKQWRIRTDEDANMEELLPLKQLGQQNVDSILEFLQRNQSKLVECLDTENGLAGCLLSKGVLNAEQHDQINNRMLYPSYRDQNLKLLNIVLPCLTSDTTCNLFLEALIETKQKHIYNFIKGLGSNVSTTENRNRILSEDELNRFDRHVHHLETLLDVERKHFLDILVNGGCITERHKDGVSVQLKKVDQNRELLSIIRRRSYADYVTFVDALKKTKQRRVLQLLEQNSGSVIQIHGDTTIEGNLDGVPSSEDIKEIEIKICDLLNNTSGLTRIQKYLIVKRLNKLNKELIHLIAAYPTGSIVVYFLCETFQSVVVFKSMLENNHLRNLLETIFNCVWESKNKTRLRLSLSLDPNECQRSIEEARRTIYREHNKGKPGKECLIRFFPKEMLERILNFSYLEIMSSEWNSTVLGNPTMSSGYSLYREVSSRTGKSAYTTMKSVTYDWKQKVRLKRGYLLKQFFLRRLHQNYVAFAGKLNCRYVLLDRLVEEKVITDEERKNILKDETHFKTRIHEYIPKYIWPQVESDKQMLTSNEKLIAHLKLKNYSQILKFLELMEDNCSTHVLNYFISNQHLKKFGDAWPLDEKRLLRMTNGQPNIVKEMDILIRMEVLEKCDKKGKEEKVGNNGKEGREEKKEKKGENKGTKEYGSEDNVGMRGKSKLRQTAMDGSNQGFDQFHGNRRKIEEGARREVVDVEGDVDMKGEEDVNGEDVISDADEFEVDATTDHMRSRWISPVDNESIPDRVNLIDLLYNEGCISFRHKQQIEQQPTQQLQNIEMFQLIKNGSIKTLKLANDYFMRTEQRHVFKMINNYSTEDVQLIGTLTMEGGSWDVYGVAWLENKIYVVCHGSNRVHVRSDEEPFNELKDDRIEIKEMKRPWDMAASGVSRSIFISDYDNRCIWRIQMPSKEISRWEIDEVPWGLSINSSDELIVAVGRDGRYYIDVYRCEDGGRIKKVHVHGLLYGCLYDLLPPVVQSSNGNFIIDHRSIGDYPGVDLISEVSIDGTKIIRTFYPRSIESNELKDWGPRHLSIDEDDNIFVADYYNARVVLLNPRLDEHQILVNRDQHQIDGPSRLCYVREKQMLIVGHRGWPSSSVSLFSLSKHRP